MQDIFSTTDCSFLASIGTILANIKAEKILFTFESELFVLAFLPYEKSCAGGKDVFIDPYLFYSNKLYNEIKRCVNELRAANFDARRASEIAIKSLLLELDLGKIGINQLFISANGSRNVYALVAVKIDEKVSAYVAALPLGQIRTVANMKKLEYTDEDVKAYEHKTSDFCKNCLRCKNVCPTEAISETKFNAPRCIRHIQDVSKDITVSDLTKIGNRFLGCELCMNACPYSDNANVVQCEMSSVAQAEKTGKDVSITAIKTERTEQCDVSNTLETERTKHCDVSNTLETESGIKCSSNENGRNGRDYEQNTYLLAAMKVSDLQHLFTLILQKEKREELASIIGKNYVRVGRLVLLALAVYYNTHAVFSLDFEKIESYADPRIHEFCELIRNRK